MIRTSVLLLKTPWDSWFWEFPEIKAALKDIPETVFSACNFGGKRPKKTKVVSNIKGVQEICEGKQECTNDHEHAPWGPAFNESGEFVGFLNTSEEAQYPNLFCTDMATMLSLLVDRMGLQKYRHLRFAKVEPETVKRRAAKERAADLKAASDKQARGKACRTIVPEHKSVVTLQLDRRPKPDPMDPGPKGPSVQRTAHLWYRRPSQGIECAC